MAHRPGRAALGIFAVTAFLAVTACGAGQPSVHPTAALSRGSDSATAYAGHGVQLSTTALTAPVTQTITVTLFGPQQFARSTGQPEAVTQSFSVPPSVHAPFFLVVDNGDAAGDNRVSSAHILLNGTEVAGPSDFNQQVADFDREVTANASDTLTVQLEGKPGSFLTISLTGTSDTVGALGGLITVTDPTSSIDGATVQIPAGALTQETTITLGPLSVDDLQTAVGRTLPSSMRFAGGIIIDAGGATFQKPAAVSLPNTLALGSGDQLLVGRIDPTLPAPANLIYQGFAQDGPVGFQVLNGGSYVVLSPTIKLAVLRGQLVDSLQAAVSGALIVSVNPTVFSAVTDSAGGFTIPAGAPGTYGILAVQSGSSAAVLGLPLPPALPPSSIVDLLNKVILDQLDLEGSPFPLCPGGPGGFLQAREHSTPAGTLDLAQDETVHTYVEVTSGVGAYFGPVTPDPVENINGNFAQKVPTLPISGDLDVYDSAQFGLDNTVFAHFDPALTGSGGAASEQGTLVGVSPGHLGSTNETANVNVVELRAGAVPCTWSISTPSQVTVFGIVTATLPDGSVGQQYSASLVTGGGVGPYTWSLDGVPGLTISGSTADSSVGVISGTPTNAGTNTADVTVTDHNGVTVNKSFTITVSPATGYGACVVRDTITNLPAAPTTAGQPLAGPGFAIETVIHASDYSQALATCTDAIYAGLMTAYVNAGNTNPAQWEVATYNSQGQPLETGCAASGCSYHKP